MTRRKKTSSSTHRGINLKKLFDYKSANIAPLLLGLFYIIFPWFNTGVLDQTTTIFGLVFISIAIMRAKESNYVLAGFCQGLIGVCYLFAIAGLVDSLMLWSFTIILFGIFLVFELEFIKFGPRTTKADAFQIVPLTILACALIAGFALGGSIYIIDFSNTFEWINYATIMLFSFVYAFQIGGWNVTKNEKSTNQLIVVLSLAAIATAVLGVYQGTLFQWS